MKHILMNFLRRLEFTNVECGKYRVEAFEKLNQSSFVFIISDWDMQPMTNIELLRKVLASEPLKYLQFIMVNTERKTLNIIAAKDAGASNYIVKLLFSDTLKAKLESLTASAA